MIINAQTNKDLLITIEGVTKTVGYFIQQYAVSDTYEPLDVYQRLNAALRLESFGSTLTMAE